MESHPDITGLLVAWRGGDATALDRLFPLVYEELRRIAHRQLSRDLINAFEQSGYFDIILHLNRAQDMRKLLDRGVVKASLHIPSDFSKRVLRGEGAIVQMLVDGTDPNPAQAALANSAVIAGSFEQSFNHGKVAIQRVDFRPRLALA